MKTDIKATVAAHMIEDPAMVLVDIRSPSSWLNGVPKSAELWSQDELDEQAKGLVEQGKKICILCYRGLLSSQIAAQLSAQWGTHFYSVVGGYEAWQRFQLPTIIPTDITVLDRYERQVKLTGFGETAQQKLENAHVLVIGAGGLGVPALLYLTGAGLGKISMVDDDEVALHNLHRQVIYNEDHVGQPKVNAAKEKLVALNGEVDISALHLRIDEGNIESYLHGVDLVIDGSDNISTRYVINDACLKHGIPWLFAAVSEFDIQLALFTGEQHHPCYRCLFPDVSDDQVNSCAEAGVLGTVPALAGILQATEAIKYITGIGSGLQQKMLSYDVLQHHFKVLKYPQLINSQCDHLHSG